jgi:PAS domain S-box-containing protein
VRYSAASRKGTHHEMQYFLPTTLGFQENTSFVVRANSTPRNGWSSGQMAASSSTMRYHDSQFRGDQLPGRRRPMPRAITTSLNLSSAFQRYALAILLVALALGLALLLPNFEIQGIEFPLLLSAIALTAWYAGTGPAIVAVITSGLAFDYYFITPIHSFYITTSEIPYWITFVLFASLLTWFSAIRRGVERDLVRSRDELQKEVVVRTQQASLLNLTHDTIFVRDLNDVITYWNHGAQELYGWSPEQAIGKRSPQLLHTIYPLPLDQIKSELINTGHWEGELEKKKADGRSVIVASRWSLQRNEEGAPIAILETNNDVTRKRLGEEEIRELNRELGKRTDELELINKELEAFAYSISHDLRAPLRHMVGFTELLQKNASSAVDDKGRRYMAMILDSAKRMGMLIDDLLAFSRIGRAETRQTMVSLDQLVKEVQGEVWQEIDGRNINWKIGALPDLYGDASMLKLAMVNLISNAVKFTRTQSRPEIEIGLTEPRNDGVVIFVRDNGVGFDMKYVNKLFGVFQRLHRAEEFEGTGIGLATVKRIIHRHGGQVWAEGSVGGGATFYLSLPKP